MYEPKLNRWAERDGKVVKWGNSIGLFRGQEFKETFKTVKEAKIREQQAIACEPIGNEREPIAIKREKLH